jgi:hypothetical protein
LAALAFLARDFLSSREAVKKVRHVGEPVAAWLLKINLSQRAPKTPRRFGDFSWRSWRDIFFLSRGHEEDTPRRGASCGMAFKD